MIEREYQTNKQIFIGGTGRSGTTVLSSYLGNHKNIYKIPVEARFLTDKDGLIDLFDSLTKNYSLDQGRVAIRNFVEIFNFLSNPDTTPYLGINLKNYFNRIDFDNVLKELIEKISDGQFYAKDFQSVDKYHFTYLLRYYLKPFNKLIAVISKGKKKNIFPLYGYTGVYPIEKMFIPHYFRNENDLCLILNKFVNSIFFNFAQLNGKKGWCEDTPGNALNFNTLSKIFKSGYFIHITRHPVGVAYSMKNQSWAPSDYKEICLLLVNLYEKLIFIHEYMLSETNVKYYLVRLENLTESKHRDNLHSFLEIDNDFVGDVIFQDYKINYYLDKIDDDDYNYIYDKLYKYIKYFSYD